MMVANRIASAFSRVRRMADDERERAGRVARKDRTRARRRSEAFTNVPIAVLAAAAAAERSICGLEFISGSDYEVLFRHQGTGRGYGIVAPDYDVFALA